MHTYGTHIYIYCLTYCGASMIHIWYLYIYKTHIQIWYTHMVCTHIYILFDLLLSICDTHMVSIYIHLYIYTYICTYMYIYIYTYDL